MDATVFVEEMKIWTERRKVMLAEQELTGTVSLESGLFLPDLSRMPLEKVGKLTAAFQDEALRARAFEQVRAHQGGCADAGRQRSRHRPAR